MNKPLQVKVASLLGYITLLMVTLVMYSGEALPSSMLLLRGPL